MLLALVKKEVELLQREGSGRVAPSRPASTRPNSRVPKRTAGEIFLCQAGGSLELVAEKHYRCDTANAEPRKDGSLAYKITRICLVPSNVLINPGKELPGSRSRISALGMSLEGHSNQTTAEPLPIISETISCSFVSFVQTSAALRPR